MCFDGGCFSWAVGQVRVHFRKVCFEYVSCHEVVLLLMNWNIQWGSNEDISPGLKRKWNPSISAKTTQCTDASYLLLYGQFYQANTIINILKTIGNPTLSKWFVEYHWSEILFQAMYNNNSDRSWISTQWRNLTSKFHQKLICAHHNSYRRCCLEQCKATEA